MSAADFDRIESLFHEAKAMPPASRTEFLARACAGDAELQANVESLLLAHDQASNASFLDAPATGTVGSLDQPGARADANRRRDASADPQALRGKSVGPYRVERFVGGGGMGDVYLAVRLEPFKQYVGLKIIRRGTGSSEVLRRFGFERQILASLNHTNIAKLLDGGITDDGLPYFAMEYVDGLPITRYCDRNKLTVRERLALFRNVCRAVQYAHQNLIIHRDLKPPNILVTKTGDVKLLDFGIAKIINPNLADVPTAVTQTQFRMLTPDYASPEQIRGEPLTTASDVYSLGVILYELLVGERPYELAGRSPGDIEHVVCETEPDRPSVKVSTTSQTAGAGTADVGETSDTGSAATLRLTSSERLHRMLKGDLDNIVMMALRKEPGRRYGSVDLLLQDVDNYVDGHPVAAHRDSRSYRIAKFVRRNRMETALAVSLVALLVVFAGYNSVQARKLARERDRAQLEARKSEEVSDFVVGLFQNANPTLAPGDAITVREVLDAGVRRAERELADQPVLQADLFSVMGTSYQALGQSEVAVDLLRRAVDLRRISPDYEAELADDLLTLGSVYNYLNRRPEAQQYLKEFVDLQTRRRGSGDPEVLMGRLHLLSSMHQIQPQTATDSMLAVWSRLEEQIDRLEPQKAATVMGYIADLLFARGDYAGAETIAVQALDLYEKVHGRIDPNYGSVLNRLNWTRIEMGAIDRALESSAEAIRINEELYPEGHRNLASAYGTRGEVLSRLGKFDEAEALIQRDLEMRIRILGDSHSTLARVYRFAGRNESRRGDYERAAEYYQQGADVFSKAFGPDYVFARQHVLSVADMRFKQERYEEAERIYLDSYRVFVRDRGADDRFSRGVAGNLADLYTTMGLSGKAAEFREKANPPG